MNNMRNSYGICAERTQRKCHLRHALNPLKFAVFIYQSYYSLYSYFETKYLKDMVKSALIVI